MANDDFPAPGEGMVLTVLLIVADQDRSRDFYRDILGAKVVLERDPCIMKFHNSWIIVNVGGGPTDDKPTVTMATPTDQLGALDRLATACERSFPGAHDIEWAQTAEALFLLQRRPITGIAASS